MDIGRGPREMYGFPVLKDDEIMQCMDELRMSITQADIAKPNGAHITKLIESFLDLLMGVKREEFNQPPFEVMTMLENPDLHLQSIQDMSLFRAMLQLAAVVGVGDFSLKDLVKPEPARVRLILSALINFAKFREMQLSIFEKLTEKTDQLTEQKAQAEQENQALAERLEMRLKQRADEEPLVRIAQQEAAKLSEQVSRLNIEQEDRHAHYNKLKEETTDLENKLETSKKRLQVLQQECALLKSQIVESPDKIQQSIHDMEQQLQTEREQVAASEKKARELKIKIDQLVQLEAEIENCIKMMQEAEREKMNLMDVQKRVAEAKETLAKKELGLKQQRKKDEQIKKQIATVESNLAGIYRQQAMKREAQEPRSIKEGRTAAYERAALKAHLEEQEALIERLEQKLSELKLSHETEMANIRSDYGRLHATVKAYHSSVLSTISSS